jgi:hypothetical protein
MLMKTIQHTAQFLKRGLGALCVVALLVCMVPRPASAQFGIDVAAILAGLQAISQALGQIQGVESQWTQFQQNTVYPQSAINQSKAAVLGWINSGNQMNSVMNVGYSSAQLPSPQSLETALMSANANQMGNVSGLYQNVYGTVPPATNAPPYVRNAIDISDAAAQDAMKKAIQLDALASQELIVSQQLLTQIQQAAPGSAPILEAAASAWLVRANAYSQSAMAELMRVRSTTIANQTGSLKASTNAVNHDFTTVQQMLGHP